jgi:hypothetical protein
MLVAGNEPDNMYMNQGYNETTQQLAADVSIFGEILKDYPYVIAGKIRWLVAHQSTLCFV